ncbi:MAG TPA: AAA family ATPase [Smithellaceae bacterium]|nr:AAA family ATPase [Smithellaceae bacterium]HQM46537.1 AAA family ATPase [Smithellaceae bacterium]
MTQIWPIGGGKGGSGKSFLTSSLGRLLAEQGRKTLVIDLDLGAANLHTLLGVPYPQKGFSDFIRKKVPRLEDTIVETHCKNLFLISGAHDNFDIANLSYEQKMKTLRAIAKLDQDIVLLDLGAGTSFNTLDFFLISQNGIFVATPEPTAVENFYRLIRSIFFRRIRYSFSASDFRTLEAEAEERFGGDALGRPDLVMKVIAESSPDKHADLQKEMASFRFQLVINQLRKHDNASLGLQMSKVVSKHLGLHVEHAGNVAYDEHVHDAIYQQAHFLDRYSYTKTALDLRAVSRRIAGSTGKQLTFDYM